MAVVAITANNTRVEDAESTSGWSSIWGGAGASAEASFPYQGTNLVNRKVTGTAGFYYDPNLDSGTSHDMTSASKTAWLVKAIVTDYAGLNATSGLRIRIWSGTSAYYQYVISGTNSPINAYDEYTARGGLFIIPIDPNVAWYRDSTTWSPALTAADYFGIEANFDSSTAKSENVGLDAIDLWTGLTLTGWDWASTDWVWQDFVDADEGTVNNRWGYASSLFWEVKLFFGQMTIGSATATEFSDSTSKILWLDGFFDSGYSRVFADIQNASTTIVDWSTHTSLGTTTVTDTRTDYVVSGLLGSFTFKGVLENFRNLIWTSACSILDASLEAVDMTHGWATISNTTFITNTATGVAFCNDPTFTAISDCTFTQWDAGHVFEITSTGTYSFDNLKFSGYGADASNAAVVYNNSGGAVTINIINGGDTPTVRNGTGATTTVNNTVTVKVTVLDAVSLSPIQNARVLLEASSGGDLSAWTDILSGLTDTSWVIQDTGFNFTNPQPVTWRVRKSSSAPYYKTGAITGTIGSWGFDNTVLLILDQ